MKRFCVFPIGLAVCLTGCLALPLPPGGQDISEQDVSAMITVGSTTEPELLERLHQAKGAVALQEGRFLVVGGGRSAGGLVLIGTRLEGTYSGPSTSYRLLVEFDEHRIARRYEFQRRGVPVNAASDVAAPRKTLVRDGRFYLSVAFSPDGKMVAAGAEGNRVVLWHLSSASEPMVFRGQLSCRQLYDYVDRPA